MQLTAPASVSRLLLALLLLIGSEVLAWNNPTGRPVVEWVLLLPGYLALSALLLDFMVRYRVRDLFGALILTGIYSLSAALVLNPSATLNDLPRTLMTRVMGAHALLAAEMLGFFLVLTRGQTRSRRYLLIGAIIVGLAWGIWVKNWPPDEGFGAVDLPVMLAYCAGSLALIALLLYGLTARPLPALADESAPMPQDALRLGRQEWLMVAVILVASAGLRLVRGEIPPGGLFVAGLLVLCWAILWFRGRKKGATLLDGCFPPQPIAFSRFLLIASLFLALAVFGYNLPAIQVGTITPYTFIGLGFTAYGLAWLPTVSLVLGIQGYLRQLATQQQ
ncbi:MAG: hypothetical protein R3E39_09165 [Anaerolineae bacterium]